jgi:hypothetical protein
LKKLETVWTLAEETRRGQRERNTPRNRSYRVKNTITTI